MAFTAGFSVNVGDPTKASDVDVLAANDDYLKNAIDTFIANDADNRVLTGTGSGTANAETNLTFDGSTLTVTGTVSATTFNGNVTGNLTGDVTGNISGNVTGGTISGTTGTFSGDVAVSTDTLFVDVSEGRVGVNAGTTPGAALDVAHTGTSAAFRVYNSQATDPYGILIDNTGANLSDSNYVADFRVGGYSILKLNNSGQMTFAPNSYGGASAGNLTIKKGSINDHSIRLEAGGTTSTYLEYRGYLGHSWYVDSTRKATLDATGLGIGTVSPLSGLHISDGVAYGSPQNASRKGTLTISAGTEASADLQFLNANYNHIFFGDSADPNVGTLLYDHTNNSMQFAVNGSERLRITSAGNMGLGDTPNAYNSAHRALQLGSRGANIAGRTDSDTIYVNANAYQHTDGNWKYDSTDEASQYYQTGGTHNWRRAASGTAGTNITWTTQAVLDSTGLGLGTSSPTTLLELNSSTGPEITIQRDDTSIAVDDVVGGIRFSSNDSSTALGTPPHYGAGIKVKSQGTVGFQNMLLYAGQNNAGYENDTPSMRLYYNGDVHFYDTSPAIGMSWDASASSLGIGTSSPTAPIDINTAGNTHLIFKYQDSSTQRSFIATNAGVSTNYNGLVIGSNATQQGTQANTGLSSWYQRLGPTDATGDAWSVAYQAAGGGVVERLRITSGGTIEIPNQDAINELLFTGTQFTNVFSQTTSGMHFGTTGSGSSLSLYSANAQAIHIDSSQRVGIGTASPAYKFVVSNGGAAGYEFNVNGLNSGVNTLTYNRSTSAYVDSAHFVDNYYIYSGQTPAERFRVESTGVCAFMTPNINIRFNGTATQSVLTNNDGVEIYTGGYIWAGRQGSSLYLNRAGTTGDVAVFYYNNTTAVGSISVTSSATAYNTSSDYRLKENLVPITGAVDRVNALQPRRFNFISDPDTTVDGFVAHEVSPIVPESVNGEKDAVDEDGNPVYQGIDQSKLVPLLTAAIQELTARIEALEAA